MRLVSAVKTLGALPARVSRVLLVAFLSALSFGFIIETPETIRQREAEEKKWQVELSASYDFSQLRKFLVREIDARREVDGVVLSKSKIAREWKPAGQALICGDWLFFVASPSAQEFTIRWAYETIDRKDGTLLQRTVTFYCVRKSNVEFAVDRVARADNELVVLHP